MPNIEDFRELKEDYEGSLGIFMAWDSVKGEILDVGSRAPHGKKGAGWSISEMMYDFVLEDCVDYLRGDIS